MAGGLPKPSDLAVECDPLMTNQEAGKTKSWTGVEFTQSVLESPVNPCGLVALSYFNDTYVLRV